MGKRVTLDDLQMSDSFEYEVRHPVTGKPVGIFFTLFNKYSERFQQAQRREALAAAKQAADREAGAIEISDEEKAARADQAGHRIVAACIGGWRTGKDKTVVFNGAEHEYSDANALALAESPGMRWLVNQLDIAIGRDGNFMKP